jgi:hypothetical protein
MLAYIGFLISVGFCSDYPKIMPDSLMVNYQLNKKFVLIQM